MLTGTFFSLIHWSNRCGENNSENVAVSSFVSDYWSAAGNQSSGVCGAVSFMLPRTQLCCVLSRFWGSNESLPCRSAEPAVVFPLSPLFNGYGWCETVPNYYKKEEGGKKNLLTHLSNGSSVLSGGEVKGPLRGAEETTKRFQRQ